MKKIIVFAICVALSLVISSPLMAIELSKEAVQAKKVPASYATVNKDGNIVFGKSATAYSPDTLDRILNAYGATLASDANIPRYATVKDGNIVFGKGATAYSPDVTHAILTAYGLTLSPEDAANIKDPFNYVKVKDGNLIFGKSPTAYSPEEFNMLLAGYQLPYAPPPPCPDADKDGVCDDQDDCPNTPIGTKVDARGCPEKIDIIQPCPDADKDGVCDDQDDCPNTPTGTEVDERGCPKPKTTTCPDADNDGVCDDQDDCPGTPKGAYVNERGCWVIENLLFDFDKAIIKQKYYPDLDDVARVLNENPDLTVELRGHTCWIGTNKYKNRRVEVEPKH